MNDLTNDIIYNVSSIELHNASIKSFDRDVWDQVPCWFYPQPTSIAHLVGIVKINTGYWGTGIAILFKPSIQICFCCPVKTWTLATSPSLALNVITCCAYIQPIKLTPHFIWVFRLIIYYDIATLRLLNCSNWYFNLLFNSFFNSPSLDLVMWRLLFPTKLFLSGGIWTQNPSPKRWRGLPRY